MKQETLARQLVIGLLGITLLLPLVARYASLKQQPAVVEMHARIPEEGGWMPASLTVQVGEPLHIRLTSDDVVHGFALGKAETPGVEVQPGEFVEITLTFDRPGQYVFYCTRWCGPNHWRMRGVIEVIGEGPTPTPDPLPRYLQLDLNIDAPHIAHAVPRRVTDPERGASFASRLPQTILERETYLTHSPAEIWMYLRKERTLSNLSDDDLWDIVAWIWQQNTSAKKLALGRELYNANCAACHGEQGKGDGVMVRNLPASTSNAIASESISTANMHSVQNPPDFSNPRILLGASPALLEGKIIRGGMGTGMPYWGSIFTTEQIDALVAYIYRFAWESAQETSSSTRH